MATPAPPVKVPSWVKTEQDRVRWLERLPKNKRDEVERYWLDRVNPATGGAMSGEALEWYNAILTIGERRTAEERRANDLRRQNATREQQEDRQRRANELVRSTGGTEFVDASKTTDEELKDLAAQAPGLLDGPGRHGLGEVGLKPMSGSGLGLNTWSSRLYDKETGDVEDVLFKQPVKTANDLLDAFIQQGKRDPAQLAQLQNMMRLAGVYGDKQFVPGVLTGSDIDAFKNVLSTMAQVGESDVANYLSRVAAYAQAAGAEMVNQAVRRQVYEINRPDPASSRLALERAYQEALGRNPTKSEMAAFTASYEAAETGWQRELIAAQQKAYEDNVRAEMMAAQGPDLLTSDLFQRYDTDKNWPAGLVAAVGAANTGEDYRPTNMDAFLGAAGPGGLAEFMMAISGQESGGNYNATNPDSGAHGRFQIMPGNWPAWAAEAGLGRNAPQTPANQNYVARFKMQQYYQNYKSWEAVAAAWYGGPGGANNYIKAMQGDGKAAAYIDRRHGGGKYPSIREYVQSIMRKMGKPSDIGSIDPNAMLDPFGQASTTITVTRPDLNARAIEAARANNPDEYLGNNIAQQFDTFTQMLDGIL